MSNDTHQSRTNIHPLGMENALPGCNPHSYVILVRSDHFRPFTRSAPSAHCLCAWRSAALARLEKRSLAEPVPATGGDFLLHRSVGFAAGFHEPNRVCPGPGRFEWGHFVRGQQANRGIWGSPWLTGRPTEL